MWEGGVNRMASSCACKCSNENGILTENNMLNYLLEPIFSWF